MMVTVAALVLSVQAQQSSATSDFVIQGISTAFVKSPNINSDYQKGSGSARPGQWLEVEVTYTWNPKDKAMTMLDAYDVKYFVLLKTAAVSESKKDTLLTGSASHVMLTPGRDKRSVMFVSPQQLYKLFGGRVPASVQQVVSGVGIEIAVGGTKMAEKADKGTGAWWSDAKTTAAFEKKDGALLEKAKTPFAVLAYDYHEPLKQ